MSEAVPEATPAPAATPPPAAPATPPAPATQEFTQPLGTGAPTEPVVVSSQSALEAFRSGLPDEMRANPLWDQYGERGMPGIAQDFLELQQRLGSETRVSRPAADAAPEEWSRFYNELGRPETVAGYDLTNFTPPEGMPWNADQQNRIVARMHAIGLSQDQMTHALQAVAEEQGADWTRELTEVTDAAQKAESDLRTEWGAAYDEKMEAAERVFTFAFGENAKAMGDANIPGFGRFGAIPAVVKGLAKIHEAMADDTFVSGEAARGMGTMTAEGAKGEYERMQMDPEIQKALTNTRHPEHKLMTARMKHVAEMAYPNQR